jgi:menaquinone-dependent protoporphyrinogen oxidase
MIYAASRKPWALFELKFSMTKVLIIHDSIDGQTAQIAARIAEIIQAHKFEVEVLDAKHLPHGFTVKGYNGILLGSPVRNRRYSALIQHFIEEQETDLRDFPSGFFSVSIADGTTKSGRLWLDGYLKSFFDETGWHPKVIGRFGGALLYTRYGFWIRIPLALAGRMMGYPTDTSRDHELTNWDDVVQFATEFISQVEMRPN